MNINQGDVVWVKLPERNDSSPGFTHPHVVVQCDTYNKSRINTVVTCVITSNIHRARIPGNVLLLKGEANLAKQSVVNVTQVYSVDKTQLVEKIGTLSKKRMYEILEGIQQVLGIMQ
ncbi:MAG: type II toxin-antitoxin system PemK/MazF family toxin [Vulcanimicrobiota bacterium]